MAVAAGALVAAALSVPVARSRCDQVRLRTDSLPVRATRTRQRSCGTSRNRPGSRSGLSWDAPYVTAVIEVGVAAGAGHAGRARQRGHRGRVAARRDRIVPAPARRGARRDRRGGARMAVRDATPAGQVYAHLLGPLPSRPSDGSGWHPSRIRPHVVRQSPGAAAERKVRRAPSRAAAGGVVRVLVDAGCAGKLSPGFRDRGRLRRVADGVSPAKFRRQPHHVPVPMGFNVGGHIDPVDSIAQRDLRVDVPRPGVDPRGPAAARRSWCCPCRGIGAVHHEIASRSRAARAALPVRARPGVVDRALPVAAPRLEHVAPLRDMSAGELDELALPPGGCGQLIGSDDAGRAVTVRLFGPGVRSVHVAGELYLAQQVVFRAVAVGARVPVHDRVGRGGSARRAAGPDRLRVAGDKPTIGSSTPWSTTACATTVPPRVTAIYVRCTRPASPQKARGVRSPTGASGDRITSARQPAPAMSLTLVTISSETAHIGRPRSARMYRCPEFTSTSPDIPGGARPSRTASPPHQLLIEHTIGRVGRRPVARLPSTSTRSGLGESSPIRRTGTMCSSDDDLPELFDSAQAARQPAVGDKSDRFRCAIRVSRCQSSLQRSGISVVVLRVTTTNAPACAHLSRKASATRSTPRSPGVS